MERWLLEGALALALLDGAALLRGQRSGLRPPGWSASSWREFWPPGQKPRSPGYSSAP